MIKTWIVKESELPYRIEIDGCLGAADSPAYAAVAALSVGKMIPKEVRRMCRWDAKEAAGYIFWNYHTSHEWARLIHILDKDTFES